MDKGIDKIIGNTVATPVRMTAGGGGSNEPFVINCTVGIHFMDKMGEYIDAADKTYEEVIVAIENKQRILMCLPSGKLVEPITEAPLGYNGNINFCVISHGSVVDHYICTVDSQWRLEDEYLLATTKELFKTIHGTSSVETVSDANNGDLYFNTEDNTISLFSVSTNEDGNEVKEWKIVNDHRPLIITFTTSDDGTISADKSYEEIKSAIISNKNIICVTAEGIAISVIARGIEDDYVYIEAFIDGDKWVASCTSDNIWELHIKTYATTDEVHANYPHKDTVYTKEEINEQLGNIETALDAIIEIQNSLIGGDGE